MRWLAILLAVAGLAMAQPAAAPARAGGGTSHFGGSRGFGGGFHTSPFRTRGYGRGFFHGFFIGRFFGGGGFVWILLILLLLAWLSRRRQR